MAVFTQLNLGWNADPNAPEPNVSMEGVDIRLAFYVNSFQFPGFAGGSRALIRFRGCRRYRLGPANDEGWYLGHCRFSRMAPAWGEFYQITGDSSVLLSPTDWVLVADSGNVAVNHYLFYLRDETFECVAESWEVELPASNAFQPNLLRGSDRPR